jgi:hypothetical protein
MPVTFPPGVPSLSGDVLSINRFLKDPLWILRALRTIEQQMFVADKIFTGQQYTESGAVGYEQNESIFADRTPKSVAPGAEYPLTPISTGPAQMANTVKWGQDAQITDEAINRIRFDAVKRAFRKLVNSSVSKIDSVALSAANSAITQSTAVSGGAWSASDGSARILRDVTRATASLLKLKQGYMPDVVFVGLDTFANVTSDDKLVAMLAREMPGVQKAPLLAGMDSPYMRQIGGFLWVTSPNAPVSNAATVLDSGVFGTFVDENLPAPGYVRGEGMTQVKTIRDDDADQYRVRARRTTVPIVLEPAAAWKITGVDS